MLNGKRSQTGTFATGQTVSAGETQLNLASDRGRSAVLPGRQGAGPYDTGQPGSAGETSLNLVSVAGREAVDRGQPGQGLPHPVARGPGTSQSQMSGQSGSQGSGQTAGPCRQRKKRNKKKEGDPGIGAGDSSASLVPRDGKAAGSGLSTRMDKCRPG